jgi:hypothetical protein
MISWPATSNAITVPAPNGRTSCEPDRYDGRASDRSDEVFGPDRTDAREPARMP